MGENPEEGMSKDNKVVLKYILNPVQCGSQSKTHTVRSWLTKYGIPLDDTYFISWNECLTDLISSIQKISKISTTGKALDMVWDIIVSLLYVNYNTAKEFLPQFEANMEKITDLFSSLESKISNAGNN
jgi:hypothetical protein